jgi:hypothetical protein
MRRFVNMAKSGRMAARRRPVPARRRAAVPEAVAGWRGSGRPAPRARRSRTRRG